MAKSALDARGNQLAVGDRVSLIGRISTVNVDGSVVVTPSVCGSSERTAGEAAIAAWKRKVKDLFGDTPPTADWLGKNPCPTVPVETASVTISDAGLLEKHLG